MKREKGERQKAKGMKREKNERGGKGGKEKWARCAAFPELQNSRLHTSAPAFGSRERERDRDRKGRKQEKETEKVDRIPSFQDPISHRASIAPSSF